MNKFEKMLTSDSVYNKRVEILSKTAELAQKNLINDLKVTKEKLELKIFNLTDLAPESSDSLRPGSKNWNATQWAKSLQEAKQDLYMCEIQLDIANKTLEEYFTVEND